MQKTQVIFFYSYYILPTTVTRKLNALNANNPVTFAIYIHNTAYIFL